MKICMSNGFCVVQTSYNNEYNLIQKFRGVDINSSIRYNCPVDFMESGLMRKDKWDYWHIDVPFALNTDEATPVLVNGCYIGANHGENSAIEVYLPNHGKTVADIGSIWTDEAGIEFTLLRVNDEDYLTFISKNIGESIEKYLFKKTITGKLVYKGNGKNAEEIFPYSLRVVDLRRAVRYKTKKVVAIKDGKEKTVSGECECDLAEIREEYEIINPATVADDLRRLRPVDGFLCEQDLAQFGKPMISCSLIYRIIENGTVLVFFDYNKLMNVDLSKILGVMFQEKLDVYKGGIYRYIPKSLPFETREGRFDFSNPLPICGQSFPNSFCITKKFCESKNSPMERCVDYFRDTCGNDKLAFACGFLPLYDGDPKIRSKQVNDIVSLKFTRKHYPSFADGVINRAKGVAYKKYFAPQKNKASYYFITFDNKTYLYVDIFDFADIDINIIGKPKLLEKSKSLQFIAREGKIKVYGEKGYASFLIDGSWLKN